jgi:hypothetical protein
MKNMHLIPTDKPSRLRYFCGKLEIMYLVPKKSDITFQNIYITNDEEIKEGEWFIHFSHGTTTLLKCKSVNLKEIIDNEGKNCWLEYSHKIILTTDPDLIKDGVQETSEEFLQWFVKNPSCEKVEIDKNWNYPLDKSWEYKIIVPKDESKQQCKDCNDNLTDCTCIEDTINMKQESNLQKHLASVPEYKGNRRSAFITKQGTLEEAINNEINNIDINSSNLENIAKYNRISGTLLSELKKSMANIAKWQAERMYSEEEVLEILKDFRDNVPNDVYTVDWFEQFKKRLKI